MEHVVFRLAPWLILLGSFAVLAVFYSSLPPEVVITRGIFGGSEILAPKTLFTVFRVPLIETVCALAILVMLKLKIKPAAQTPYVSMWLILLFTVSLKSLFQSLETVSSPAAARIFFYTTIIVVAAGIILAFIPGRKVLADWRRADIKLSARDRLMLAGLLSLYLGFAIVPAFVFGS